MFEKLKSLLINELRIKEEQIKPESQLANDLGINSLELADLILQCEEKFGITIDDEDLSHFITVSDVACYLEQHSV